MRGPRAAPGSFGFGRAGFLGVAYLFSQVARVCGGEHRQMRVSGKPGEADEFPRVDAVDDDPIRMLGFKLAGDVPRGLLVCDGVRDRCGLALRGVRGAGSGRGGLSGCFGHADAGFLVVEKARGCCIARFGAMGGRLYRGCSTFRTAGSRPKRPWVGV